jgi:hypothetical protein
MWFRPVPKSILSKLLLATMEQTIRSERINKQIPVFRTDRAITLVDFGRLQRRQGKRETDGAAVAVGVVGLHCASDNS